MMIIVGTVIQLSNGTRMLMHQYGYEKIDGTGVVYGSDDWKWIQDHYYSTSEGRIKEK